MWYYFLLICLATAAHVDPNVESCLHINVNEYTVTSELTDRLGECFTSGLVRLSENDTFHLTASYTYKVQALQAKHIINDKMHRSRSFLLDDRNHQATTLQR